MALTSNWMIRIIAALIIAGVPLALALSSTRAVKQKPCHLKTGKLGCYLVKGQKRRVINRTVFYQRIKAKFHRRGLTKAQLESYEAMLDYWDSRPELTDLRWLAYVLGTALHETAGKMVPVRETLASTDREAIRRMDRSGGIYASHRRKGKTYWRKSSRHGNRAYFGRGFIQITFASNYKKMGRELGMGQELYLRPELALNSEVAVKLIFVGMVKGLYRGDRRGRHSLARHFPYNVRSSRLWIRARDIVNGGRFHADRIAVKARAYHQALLLIDSSALVATDETGEKPPAKPAPPRVATVPEPTKDSGLQDFARQKQIADLQGALLEAQAKLAAVRAQQEKARKVIIAERDRALAERDQVAQARDAALAAKTAALGSARTALAEAQQASARRDQALAERDQALAERDQVAQARDAALAAKTAALASAASAMAEARKANAALARLQADSAAEIERLKARLAETTRLLEQNSGSAGAQLLRLKGELETARSQLAAAQGEAATARQALATARQQADAARQALADEKAQSAAKDQAAAQARARLARQVATMVQSVQALEGELAQIRSDVAFLDQYITAQQNEIQHLRGQIKQPSKWQRKLQELKQKYLQLPFGK